MERDELFNFRQPLVTGAGIILGFVLNFATELVKKDARNDLVALVILGLTLVGIVLLIVAMYRILNHRYPKAQAGGYYARTLNYFVWGVIFSFGGGLVKMMHTFALL